VTRGESAASIAWRVEQARLKAERVAAVNRELDAADYGTYPAPVNDKAPATVETSGGATDRR
jgi:hypothetical protein